MQVYMLRSKIHRATVTDSALDYEGSCSIDAYLLKISGILVNERIDIYNINNGERFTTYAIAAPEHSGIISLNGAAARKGLKHDLVIICAYAAMTLQEAEYFAPKLVYVDTNNRILNNKVDNQPILV